MVQPIRLNDARNRLLVVAPMHVLLAWEPIQPVSRKHFSQHKGGMSKQHQASLIEEQRTDVIFLN